MFPDLNNNGRADYNEGFFWRGVWSVVSFTVRTFAPAHTVIRKAVDAAEAERERLKQSKP